jgi:hypothetical protein
MGVGYQLVNQMKKEVISYSHIPATNARELAGNPVAAAITSWYLLQHQGDEIAFVSDTYDDWPFPSGSKQDMKGNRDVTDERVNALVDAEIIQDDGIAWADDKQPNEVYIRALLYVWLDENGEKH